MNNYDISSKGDNIELNVCYDSDLASFYYRNFINGADGNMVYKIESSRDVIALLIGDSDKPYYKKSQLAKMKKAELIELWLAYEYGYNEYGYSKAELIADLKNTTIASHYDFIFKQNNWLSIKDYITHGYFISRGYSQGDAVYIIDVGADYDVLACRSLFNHILWDTPVSLSLSVNDDDELGYELLNDEYVYDKNAIIENVNKLDISDYAKTWISENLPNEPRYL